MSKRFPSGKATAVKVAKSCLLLHIFALIMTCSCAEKIIFHPPSPTYDDGPHILKIETDNGQDISAIYLKNPSARFTVLFSHGNAEDIGQNLDFFDMLHDRGYSVLAYDYRGYGTSGGAPSEKNVYRDIESAYRYLVDKENIDPRRIIALGRSIGGGAAAYLAAKEDIGGLIFESSFVSAFRVATRTPIFPFDEFNNIDRIAKVKCPVMIIHGTNDDTISIWHGKQLYEKANEPKLSLWVENAGHTNLLETAGESYWQAMDDFTTLIMNRNQQHTRAK